MQLSHKGMMFRALCYQSGRILKDSLCVRHWLKQVASIVITIVVVDPPSLNYMFAKLASGEGRGCQQHRGLADALCQPRRSVSPALSIANGPKKSTRKLEKGPKPAQAQRRHKPSSLHLFSRTNGLHDSAKSSQGLLASKPLSRKSVALPKNNATAKRKFIHRQTGADYKKRRAHVQNKKPRKLKICTSRVQILKKQPILWTVRPAIGGSHGPSITHWLEEMRQDRLRSAVWRKGQLFIDLFSGRNSPVGRQVGKRGGAFIAFDVLIDVRFDLSNPEVQETLMRWIRQGLVWSVWLGTDCTTWSRASYSKGPGWLNSYRTQHNLWGQLSSLSTHAKEKVLQGNAHLRFSIAVLQQIADQPLATGGFENPASSVIWLLPELQALGEGMRFHKSTCHYCQYGTRWKKPTHLLFVGGAKALAPCKLCQGKAKLCNKTGLPHLQLGGGRCHPSSGKVLTQLATEYPPALAARMVDCLTGGISR